MRGSAAESRAGCTCMTRSVTDKGFTAASGTLQPCNFEQSWLRVFERQCRQPAEACASGCVVNSIAE
jgi:hypothetical protein